MNASSPRGSVALSTLLSTTIGLTLALLYMNIARYTAGMNAVEQATRQMLRCLAPTDGECANYRTAAAAPSWEWLRTDLDPLGELRARRFNYSGTLYLERWRATYPYFEIDQVTQPAVTWQQFRLPIRRYESLPPSEYRFARHRRSAEHDVVVGYEPAAAGPLFPVFRESDERSFDTRSTASWTQGSSDNGFLYSRFNEAQIPGARRIVRAGRTEEFITDAITIGSPLAQTLACAPGGQCGAASLAGGSANVDFRSDAFVAIKAFAEVRRAPGSSPSTTMIRWGRPSANPLNRFGLEIIRSNGSRIACLGGRSDSNEIGPGWENYNLWLRGPAGASGGTSSVCPGGDLDHSNLRVPRGSSIRVRAWLGADESYADADVRVRIC